MSDDNVQSDKDKNQSDLEKNKTSERTKEELEARLLEVSAEAKRYRQERSQYKDQLESDKAARLKEQGDYKTMYETVKSENETFKNAASRGAKTSAIKDELNRLGCRHSSLLVAQSRLEGIEIDENYRANTDQVGFEVQRLQKAFPDLFKKESTGPKDGTPSDRLPGGQKKKRLEDMTQEEIEKELRDNY